jgi:PAS domain-containing protein
MCPGSVMSAVSAHPDNDAEMFDLAPVSLWIEDYSAVRALFDQWRAAGVDDIKTFLAADQDRVRQCSARIRILKVNRKTLSLFGARDLPHLMANLGRVLRDDTFDSLTEELVQLWNKKTSFSSHTVNYTLAGTRLDIQLSGTILPGHEQSWDRVMVAIEDVTERENARRRLVESENHAFGLFAHSPVSLWVEDFSGVKRLMDDVRARGVEDFRVFTDVHAEFVPRCMSEIRVLDVNGRTLELFGMPDMETLLNNLAAVFRDEMEPHFREQLVDLWDGKLFQQREVVNYALDGTKLHLLLQFSVLPNHEHDWSLVQVALTDITARKKAEAYLEYLGTHDVLTRTLNRSFFVDELNRLDRKGPKPVTVIIADLNGLKTANDELGHGAGDALLRRAGRGVRLAGREAGVGLADRRRRVRRAAARHRRGRRRSRARRADGFDRTQQSVSFRPRAQHLDRDRHQPARRPAGTGGQTRRHEDVSRQAPALSGGQAGATRLGRGVSPPRPLRSSPAL